MTKTVHRTPKPIHRTDRFAVTYLKEKDGYAIELPTDFDQVYKVNAAHIHFYQPGADDPLDSFEMNFAEKRLEAMDGLELPDDRYAGCEYEVVFLYHPGFGLPYERVREEVTELQPTEELDEPVTVASTLINVDEMNHIDYLCIDVRDPETGEYLTGDVIPIDNAGDSNGKREALLASGTVQVFPSEFAGLNAEITYLRE